MTDQPLGRTDRRRFLERTAAAVTAGLLPVSMSQASSNKEGWVDAHSHIWTPDTSRYPLAHNLTADDLSPRSFTDKELLAVCGPLGVGRVVLIQHTLFHRFDNRYITDAITANPGVFSGVAVIDDAAAAPEREMIRLKGRGIRGFRIVPRNWHGDQGPVRADKWLTGAGMQQMWKTAADEQLAMCPLINPEYIPSVEAMCRRFPDTTVVVDHFARIGIDGTIRESDLKNLCALAQHRNTFIKISAYYALGRKQPPHTELIPMIRRLLDVFGPERLMWASDAPYQIVAPNNYRASIDLIRERMDFLTGTDRQWLLRGTAEKVFFN